MAVYPVDVKIFSCGPKCWTEWHHHHYWLWSLWTCVSSSVSACYVVVHNTNSSLLLLPLVKEAVIITVWGQPAEQMDRQAGQTCRGSAGQTPRCSALSHAHEVWASPQPPFCHITAHHINLTQCLHTLYDINSTLEDHPAAFLAHLQQKHFPLHAVVFLNLNMFLPSRQPSLSSHLTCFKIKLRLELWSSICNPLQQIANTVSAFAVRLLPLIGNSAVSADGFEMTLKQ